MKLSKGVTRFLSVVALGMTVFLGGCFEDDANKNSQQNQPAPSQTTQAPAAVPANPTGTTASLPLPAGEASTVRNIYVVFDGSGSMGDCPDAEARNNRSRCTAKIVSAKAPLITMVQGLPDDTNLGLYVFDQRGDREVLKLGPNQKERFIAEVNRVSAGGGTPLGEAIQAGVRTVKAQYDKQLGYGEFRLVTVTDGDATSKSELTKGVKAAAANKVPLFTIGFDIGHDHELFRYSVRYWAADTGTALKAALQEAVSEIDIDDAAPKR